MHYMNTKLLHAAFSFALLPLVCAAAPEPAATGWPCRWVWIFGWGLRADGDAGEIEAVIRTAARAGLNGAVLSAGLDTLCKQPPEYFRRLDAVKAACDSNGLELIPAVFSVGYGGGALAHDRRLAEGLPVEDAIFVVHGEAARIEADPAVRIANGGFEDHADDRFKAFAFHDSPGVISFADARAAHTGSTSLRLENFTANPHGHGRVMQEVRVRPHRCYRVSIWVKTEGLEPARGFRLLALAADKGREVAPRSFRVEPTGDWRKLTMLLNSLGFDRLRLYAGMWGGRAGKLWLDDWTIEEVGPINVLTRPTTPVKVASEDGAVTYAEGRDYAPLEDPRFNFYSVDREAPSLRLLPGGRIRDGERLRVSWFHPMVINESQVTVCMGEPALYAIYEEEARLLGERLRPRRVLLNMDEIRMGGTCPACRGRDLGALLGECVTRQVEALRRHNPGVEVCIWSDMFDPNHNAHGDYYLAEGDFAGSWRHVPKDLVMAVWGGAPRPESLRFFANEGFATLIACYYDADDLDDVRRWIDLAAATPRVRGFMYTPWQKKYALLGEFGELLRGK